MPAAGNKTELAVGPPHLMHAADWRSAAEWWLRYTVTAKREWGQWTSEMAGFSISLARFGLRGGVENGGMWDNALMAMPAFHAAGVYDVQSIEPKKPPPDDPQRLHLLPPATLPSLFHYCFGIEGGRKNIPEALWALDPKRHVGDYEQYGPGLAAQQKWEVERGKPLLEFQIWSKYRLPDMTQCAEPLMFEYPPLDYMLRHYAPSDVDKGYQLFFAAVVPAINAALTAFKRRHCPAGAANFSRVARSAHDGWWASRLVTVLAPEEPLGFAFRPAESVAANAA